jgi:hypothetical protein
MVDRIRDMREQCQPSVVRPSKALRPPRLAGLGLLLALAAGCGQKGPLTLPKASAAPASAAASAPTTR